MNDHFNLHPTQMKFFKIRRKSDGKFYVHYWAWSEIGKVYQRLGAARAIITHNKEFAAREGWEIVEYVAVEKGVL